MTQVREPPVSRGALLPRSLSGRAIAGATAGRLAAGAASAKVEGDTVILGSANSLTGKYSSNGIDTQNGYDLAIKVINEMGGVTVGGKKYKLAVQYYDDESTPARTAPLPSPPT